MVQRNPDQQDLFAYREKNNVQRGNR